MIRNENLYKLCVITSFVYFKLVLCEISGKPIFSNDIYNAVQCLEEKFIQIGMKTAVFFSRRALQIESNFSKVFELCQQRNLCYMLLYTKKTWIIFSKSAKFCDKMILKQNETNKRILQCGTETASTILKY